MTPLTTTLTGAIGIRAGLGRETVTLDLTGIPEDAVTVAMRGDNGSGKSTLLNLGMTPWREPPVQGAIYDHFGPEGLRELIWTHGGERYRSRIEYRQNAKTRTQRAYLHRYDGAEWQPVELPDRTVSDGKARTYDACLEHILGRQDIYYLAAFRAQGAAKLAEHDDPKGLMRDLLNLDEPARMSDAARDVARELRRHYETMRSQVTRLDDHPQTIAELEGSVARIEAELPALAAARVDASAAVARAKAELERVMSEDLDNQRLADQRAAVAARLEEAKKRAAVAAARLAAAQSEHGATLRTIKADIDKATARARQADALLARRADIDAAVAAVAALERRLSAEEQTLESLRERLAELQSLAAKAAELDGQLKHVGAAGKTCAMRRDDLQRRAGYIEEVPCGGRAPFDGCPALQDAIAARAAVPEAEAEITAKRQEYLDLQSRAKGLLEQTVDMAAVRQSSLDASDMIRTLRAELADTRKRAAESSAIAQAAEAKTAAERDASDLNERMAALVESQCEQEKSLTTDAYEAARSAETVAVELRALPEPGSDQPVTRAKWALAEAEAAVQRVEATSADRAAAKAGHLAEVSRLTREMNAAADVIARCETLAAEIARWNLLASALRGIIDLTIEDAGPGIAELANRLLTEAYGPRFSVRIVTQREQQNGRLVECFDISVIDAESGIESSVLHKSGGESVWIDKALTDAVGLYHQEAAGVHYETLFSDEAEDGLTQERKSQFYRMDRAALGLGGYRRKYFVSHNPDAWAMADHVIDLTALREAA